MAFDGKRKSGLSLEAVRKSMRQIRAAIGATVINPSLLTFAEKLQYEGYVRREETNAAILSLSQQGIAVKEIVRRTGYNRALAPKDPSGPALGRLPCPTKLLEPYLPWLEEQWVRIPTQSGQGFRFDVGHGSDLMPATIPR